MIDSGGYIKRAIVSVMMLVSWEIWKERNAIFFQNVSAPTSIVIAKIKEEAHLWSLAGAKQLSTVMSRE